MNILENSLIDKTNNNKIQPPRNAAPPKGVNIEIYEILKNLNMYMLMQKNINPNENKKFITFSDLPKTKLNREVTKINIASQCNCCIDIADETAFSPSGKI